MEDVETLCQPTILFLWALTKAIVLTPSSLSQGRLGSAVVETNRKILTSVCFEHTKPTECPADLPGVNSEIPLVLWPHRVTEASSTMLSQQRKKVGH